MSKEPIVERKLSKHNRYYQRTREEQKAKSLKHYHSIGKAQRQMREKAAQERDVAVHEETLNNRNISDSDMCDSDTSWLEDSESSSDGGSIGEWYDSDASVEDGLLSVDETFLEGYQSMYWMHDRDDTVDYRIRCLRENLELWLSRWGGVRNWPRIAANPVREVQIKAQMELGIQYATLMRQVWGASVQRDTIELREIEEYWEGTARMMTRLYKALSILGSHMDWDSE